MYHFPLEFKNKEKRKNSTINEQTEEKKVAVKERTVFSRRVFSEFIYRFCQKVEGEREKMKVQINVKI